MIKVKKGLELPITGGPRQTIGSAPHIKKVAILGDDYVGMKPTLLVKVGDTVQAGTPLFSDKKNEGVIFTAPLAGRVVEINRGEQRRLLSVVIAVEGSGHVDFKARPAGSLGGLKSAEIEETLIKSGAWTSFRTRPYSKVPAPGSRPHSVFVTLMDSNPLAADVGVVLKDSAEDFKNGLTLIAALCGCRIWVCHAPGLKVDLPAKGDFKTEAFAGPHPAGLAGTHIHFLDPVGRQKTVWSINYQDVIGMGRLFTTGRVQPERVISLAGPAVKDPVLMRVPLGASTEDLTGSRLQDGENRVISGPVLSGHSAAGPVAYLGRYHWQVSVLPEGREREFMGWQAPGWNKFSVKRVFASDLFGSKKRFPMTTSTGGSIRAIVPVGSYEKVMPLDIEPTYLLRTLFTQDMEQAQQLGVLELDEDDLGLCTFVCPTKEEYGPMLRRLLTNIEKDG